MPDGAEALSRQYPEFEAAKAVVAAWLERLGAAPLQPLSATELGKYKGRKAAFGWRLSVEIDEEVCRLDLLLPQGFPWQPVRIALVDHPPFLTWPHVEKDGVLCLAPDSLEVDPDDPAGVAACSLDEAIRLTSALTKGELAGHFQDEVLSYWSYAADEKGVDIVSLMRPEPPSRTVKVWRGQATYVMAETEADLCNWLANRHGKKPDDFQAEDAAFVWLKSPPIPSAYPATGKALRELVGQQGKESEAVLSELVGKRPDKLVVALGMATTHGPALAGVVVPKPNKASHGAANPLTKGFRPGKVPDEIILGRYLGGSRVSRRSIDRADPDWVHGRGHDPRAAQLRQKTVLIIGCGSVGGGIAVQLAQAGIGRAVLADPDILKWPNIGRHVLGGSAVGQAKAVALAEKLRMDFPHIDVVGYRLDADSLLREHSELVAQADFIVSATGSWNADTRIDAWQRTAQRPAPVLYGWLEAHASAAHSVLIGGPPESIRSGFDGTGLPNFSVATWSNEGTRRQEPGCGAVFQPYGPVELNMANSVIADLALDALLQPCSVAVHRVWVAPKKRLDAANGSWSDTWRNDPQFRPEGGFVFERTWPKANSDEGEAAAA
ncbi:UBA/THIF-type NAD/FAD binding protein [Thalassospira sp. KO164]|mgnify:FL=1|nr:UBA/THIF-type NAD/FAD binding protein [Thalassospira sp. KO164]SEE79866.1 E2 family protein B [Thalassospira permensis]